jgi:hypothetical protein
VAETRGPASDVTLPLSKAAISAVYRLSMQYRAYADARQLHDALIRANPDMLM